MRVPLLLCSLLFAANAHAAQPVLLVFGDSLSAGYGLPAGSAWPNLLQQELSRRGSNWQVVNASVSGETTAGGLARLPAALKTYKPQLVILELGANDGLRGQSITGMENNLASMIQSIQKNGAKVHLVGMQIPTNYGPEYTQKFTASYEKLAQEYKTTLTPFLFTPIINHAEYFQADGLHPTIAAQPLLLQHILKDLKL